MKVKDLKKFLSKYPDTMDIKMNIPLVDDWADIKIQPTHLKRMKKSEHVAMCNWQNKEYNLGRPKKKITDTDVKNKKMTWEYANVNIDKENGVLDVYQYKEALVITSVFRGKKTFDRLGTIEY